MQTNQDDQWMSKIKLLHAERLKHCGLTTSEKKSLREDLRHLSTDKVPYDNFSLALHLGT